MGDHIVDFDSEGNGFNQELTFTQLLFFQIERINRIASQEMEEKVVRTFSTFGTGRMEQTERKEDPRNSYSEAIGALYDMLAEKLDKPGKDAIIDARKEYQKNIGLKDKKELSCEENGLDETEEEKKVPRNVKIQYRYICNRKIYSALCGVLHRKVLQGKDAEDY